MVKVSQGGVQICYETSDRILKTMNTKQCVMCSPKFIAKRIIPEMSFEQKKACDSIEYRSYIVASVFINTKNHRLQQKSFSPCFDLYCLEGQLPPSPTALNPPDRAFTHICFGSWANGDRGEFGVLTVYKPLPYQGDRQFLFSPNSHNKHKNLIRE